MAVTNYTAEFPGSRTDAEGAADPFDVEAWGRAAVAADTTPPVVSNVTPIDGSTIDPRDSVSERVTDDQALRGVVLVAKFADLWETIYEGRLVDDVWVGAFGPGYTGSTIADTTGGYDFVLRRAGGWTRGFTLANRAFDTGGNSNT